nr:unnamed protein product [Callosobruchus analis]
MSACEAEASLRKASMGGDGGAVNGAPLRLSFRTDGRQAPWDAALVGGTTLYVAMPEKVPPEGSREAFVALLDAAEEKLRCKHIENVQVEFISTTRQEINTFNMVLRAGFSETAKITSRSRVAVAVVTLPP